MVGYVYILDPNTSRDIAKVQFKGLQNCTFAINWREISIRTDNNFINFGTYFSLWLYNWVCGKQEQG